MADVTIDGTIVAGTGRGFRSIVFVSPSVGYCIFIDSVSAVDHLAYRKTTDGGATWAAAVDINTGNNRAMDVWFDKWTPGDTGTKIHIAYVNITDNDVKFRQLDTNGDSLGTEVVAFNGASVVTGRGVFCSVTKSNSGQIYIAYDIDAGAEKGFIKSTDGGASFGSSLSTTFVEASSDEALLFPAQGTGDGDDCWAIYMDASANALTLKLWDSSAATASESATIQSHTDQTTDLTGQHGYSASLRHSDGHIILAAVNAYDSATGDHEVYDITSISTFTQKTNIMTNADDHYYPAVFIDQSTDDIYVAYNGLRDGSEVIGTTTKIYYTKSTDGGANWSTGDTAYQEGATSADFQTFAPLMGDRFFVAWRVGTTIIGNAVNSVTFSVTVTPSPASAAFGVFAPSIVKGAVTLSPSPASAAFSLVAPAISNGLTLHPNPASSSFGVFAPTVIPGAVVMLPNPASAAFAVFAPALIKGALTLSPTPVTSAFGVFVPTISTGVVLVPNPVAAALSVVAPTLIKGSRTLTPTPAFAVFAIPTPIVTGGGGGGGPVLALYFRYN